MSAAIVSTADVVDRLAISDVLIRYATAMDSRDWELLASCFTDDAVLDYDTSGTFGRDDFADHCRAGLARMKATQHCVTNHVISIDGDRARSTSYVIAQHVRENDVTFTLGGSYTDDLVRDGGDWRIAERRFVTSWKAGRLRD
jgi:3-phenylpropionate/cinnamic acid dioxygenase small subunit